MNKPVDTLEFWATRLYQAERSNDLRQSVFQTKPCNWEKIDARHAAILRNHISPGQSVLDAGCGYGRASVFIPGTYTGVDHYEGFIDVANREHPGKLFVQADLEDLHMFKDNEFDWAVCISLQAMVARELGWGRWMVMQEELLRVSKEGILSLEYTSSYSWIREQ